MEYRFVVVTLRFRTPWSVTSPENSEGEVDLPCRRDPFGNLVVPATSVAGSLREHFRSTNGDDFTTRWFGSRLGDGDDGRLDRSRIRVLGTQMTGHADGGGSSPTTVVERTSIDPARGAAREKSLHVVELAPDGAEVDVFLRLDRSSAHDQSRFEEDEFLETLRSWRPNIGRGRTSGLGRASLVSIRTGVLDLASEEGLRSWLSRSGSDLVRAVATEEVVLRGEAGDEETDDALLLNVRMRSNDAIWIGGGRTSGNRSWPAVRSAGSLSHRQVIEGSSLKGMFRSRVGFILRSIGIEVCSSQGGCVRNECPLCWMFGSTTQRGRVDLRAAPLDGGWSVTRTHVSIDRFTGGALPAQLFTEESLLVGAEFTLAVGWDDRDGPAPDWVAALLAWVVRDIHNGYVGVGGRTSRGLGSASIADEEDLRQLIEVSEVAIPARLAAWCSDRVSKGDQDA